MSNSEKAKDESKISKSTTADESNLTLSDTCLLNSSVEPQNVAAATGSSGTTGKKNKHSKHHSSSFSGVSHKNQDKSGIKQKIVNKVMSWNSSTKPTNPVTATSSTVAANSSGSKDKDYETENLSAALEGINLSTENSEENLCKADWLRARDSLENLLYNRSERQNSSCGEIINSRSTPFSTPEKSSLSESSPHSEAALGNKTQTSQSIAKVLNWDPWDKLGRKNKRENKRRKFEKSSLPSRDSSSLRVTDVESSRKDHTSGDELRPNETARASSEVRTAEEAEEEDYTNYTYQPYHARNSKSVDFTNEVKVVYFTGDEVVGEAKEPLKKELDQQIRNKEMRKGHCPAMLMPKRKQHSDDYMSLWFKK